MRVAALYDIHGNLPALEAVLHDVRQAGVDQVVVGGDVLPGPMPCETIAALLSCELPVRFLRGNGDRVVLAQRAGAEINEVPEAYRGAIRWVAEQLPPEYVRLLAGWPKTLRLEVEGLEPVLFCHATPRNDTEVFSRRTPADRLAPVFAGVAECVVVCGHTHMQFDRLVGGIRIVNAGSVGMPFGEPGAFWLLLGPDIQLRRTDYDRAKAAERVRATSYPGAEDFAAHGVLQPPSEEEMLKVFARAEVTG